MSQFTKTTFVMVYKWGFTCRVNGYGFILRKAGPCETVLFSERYGYRKIYRFLGWRFEWLKP